MEILFYQGLIVITLLLVRAFARKYLELACFVWTVFSLVNLFWPPLLVLQLIIVWGTYSVIRSKPPEAVPAEVRYPKPAHSKQDMMPNSSRGSTSTDFSKETAAIGGSSPRPVQSKQKMTRTAGQKLEFVTPQGMNRPAEPSSKVDIRMEAIKRKIPHLVHFTRCDNLPSILHHGLKPVTSCHAEMLDVNRNDSIRLDGNLDGTSLSVTFPNYRMFYKYRQLDPSLDWAVLLLSPSILWELDCGFFRHNAADSSMRKLARSEVGTAHAFAAMFEANGVPRDPWLRACDPTDPQAEVMVFETIERDLIETVAFETKQAALKWDRHLKGIDKIFAGPGKGLFGSRKNVRQN